MNSFNFAAKGIEREIARQIAIYEAGGMVEQETLHFEPGDEDSPPLRSKEEAQDYRYFPEPDLVPVAPVAPSSSSACATGSASCPASGSSASRATLSFSDADVLVMGGLDRLWSAIVAAGADAKEAANVLANAFVATGVDPARVDAARAREARRGTRPRSRAPPSTRRSPASATRASRADPYLAHRKPSATLAELDPVIDAVLAANPAQVEQYRAGKDGLIGFFVGQVMKRDGRHGRPARRERASAGTTARLRRASAAFAR